MAAPVAILAKRAQQAAAPQVIDDEHDHQCELGMQPAAGESVERLKTMARKLYHFASVLGVLAIASGLWLWLRYGFAGGWLHAKLTLVLLLVGYHISMRVYTKRLIAGGALPGSTALRWYNELPLLLLIGILWLVVVKPF